MMVTERTPVGDIGLPILLTTIQVAEALHVNPTTLSRWRSQGIGPRVYWISRGSPRYRRQDVLDWLERNAS